MDQEREKIVEYAVLTFVGLLAIAAILVFLPDASARIVYQPVRPLAPVAMSSPSPSTERPIQAE